MSSLIYYKQKASNEPPGFSSHLKMAPYRAKSPNFKELEKTSRLAAVSIILYEKNNEVFLPLIKRPVYNGHHSGQISLPGGKIELIDSNLIETALRETKEEIGIESNLLTSVKALTKIYIPPSNFVVSPFVMFANADLAFSPDNFEVESILEIKLSSLLDETNLKFKKLKHSDNLIIDTPYFELNNEMVWGATAMILSELKDLLK